MKYRFKLPTLSSLYQTQSFGIEPYYVRKRDDRVVKAGKAIIRCVIYNARPSSFLWASEAAARIVQLLNEGREYKGPKVLLFARPHSVEGYFND